MKNIEYFDNNPYQLNQIQKEYNVISYNTYSLFSKCKPKFKIVYLLYRILPLSIKGLLIYLSYESYKNINKLRNVKEGFTLKYEYKKEEENKEEFNKKNEISIILINKLIKSTISIMIVLVFILYYLNIRQKASNYVFVSQFSESDKIVNFKYFNGVFKRNVYEKYSDLTIYNIRMKKRFLLLFVNENKKRSYIIDSKYCSICEDCFVMKKSFLKESNVLYKEIEYSEMIKRNQSIMVRKIINNYKNSYLVKGIMLLNCFITFEFFYDYYKLYMFNSEI